MRNRRPKVAEDATPSQPVPGKLREAVKVDKRDPDATPRHRMAGSHDGMFVTEHHRTFTKKS